MGHNRFQIVSLTNLQFVLLLGFQVTVSNSSNCSLSSSKVFLQFSHFICMVIVIAITPQVVTITITISVTLSQYLLLRISLLICHSSHVSRQSTHRLKTYQTITLCGSMYSLYGTALFKLITKWVCANTSNQC